MTDDVLLQVVVNMRELWIEHPWRLFSRHVGTEADMSHIKHPLPSVLLCGFCLPGFQLLLRPSFS